MKPEEIETIRVALLTETTHKEFEANSLKAMQILNKYEAVNNGVLDDVIVCKCENESYYIESDGFKYCESCHKNKPY